MKIGLRAVLAASLLLNAALWLVWRKQAGASAAGPASIPSSAANAAENLPRPDLRKLDGAKAGDRQLSSLLVRGGLTAQEAENIQIWLINQEFEKKRRALLEITDPWLTADEILAEGQKRLESVKAAEAERRMAIERATGRKWHEVAVHSAWGKANNGYALMAKSAGIGVDEMARFRAALAAGWRESVFAKADAFELKRKESAAATQKLVAETEARMIALTGEEKFRKFAQELVGMDLEDVWSWEERLGRKVTAEEGQALKAAALPEQPLSHYLGYGSGQSGRSLPESALPKVRAIVGEETFGHLLELQHPDLKWSASTHVEVFDLEQSFRAEFRKLHPETPFDARAEDDATVRLRESYRHRVAEKLGENMDGYLSSGKGGWFNPRIDGE